jgi:hypothetical protein
VIAIVNVFLVIGASFVFGYKLVEYSLDEPTITTVSEFIIYYIVNILNNIIMVY